MLVQKSIKQSQAEVQNPWGYDIGLAVGHSHVAEWISYAKELARRIGEPLFERLTQHPFIELGGGWGCTLRSTAAWFGAPSYINVDPNLGFGRLLPKSVNGCLKMEDNFSVPTSLVELDALNFLRSATGPFNCGVRALGHGLSYTSSEYNHCVCLELSRVIPEGGLLLAQNAPLVATAAAYGFVEIEPIDFGGDEFTADFEKCTLFARRGIVAPFVGVAPKANED